MCAKSCCFTNAIFKELTVNETIQIQIFFIIYPILYT